MADGDDAMGALIGGIIGIALLLFVLYVIILIATAIATIAATGGFLWGGGWAVLNYGRSIKQNLIDSNRTSAAA